MAQNIYDNPKFFEGYTQLPRQIHGLEGAPEWPALQSMLIPVSDKRVVDLGCGFGWVSRWMRDNGAKSVLGLDLSEKMIERARKDTKDTLIEYRIADLDQLTLPPESFDIAFSSLTFHYVRDFERLVKTIHHSLSKGGQFVFSIEHPVYMAAAHPHWIMDEEGRKTWPVNGYSVEGERKTDWFIDGVIKYHRTMATTINTLISCGFEILQVKEFAPSAEQIAKTPALLEELERPMMLLVSAAKR
ncbi:class I SAM-dependent methyltransferase [Bdellovibrio bacteriovorus]|uniref:SAM-dependent methyltransferase n=1 Tax=Bdellovibrio bacteriovorus TaxID=959 RepID=A0A1Z3NCF1_BDEBC|nr:class I SAM-dependent methyltransferase [Bdellovibrio bacteriovorus]ASD65159.1 SAM-dependent methyltransferase [Bdellovibrio bacteriovorus]